MGMRCLLSRHLYFHHHLLCNMSPLLSFSFFLSLIQQLEEELQVMGIQELEAMDQCENKLSGEPAMKFEDGHSK